MMHGSTWLTYDTLSSYNILADFWDFDDFSFCWVLTNDVVADAKPNTTPLVCAFFQGCSRATPCVSPIGLLEALFWPCSISDDDSGCNSAL